MNKKFLAKLKLGLVLLIAFLVFSLTLSQPARVLADESIMTPTGDVASTTDPVPPVIEPATSTDPVIPPATTTDPVISSSEPATTTDTEILPDSTDFVPMGASLFLPLIPPPSPSAILEICTVSNLIISPSNVTSPGILDDTDIDIKFSSEVENVSIDIIDDLGNPVKHLYDAVDVTNPASKTWSGKDETDNFVADGNYTIQIVWSDASGTATDTSKTILVDNVSPTVSPAIITPSYNDGSTLYIAGLSTISAAVSDSGAGIDGTSCQYSIDGGSSGATVVPTAYDSVSGNCVFADLDTSAASGIAVSVKDLAGNQFNTSGYWINVTPDSNVPVIGPVSITPSYVVGGITYVSTSSNLSVPVSDTGSGMRDCGFGYDIGGIISWDTADVPVGGNCVLAGANTSDSNLNKILVQAYDNLGYQQTAEQPVTLDASAPITMATAETGTINYSFDTYTTGSVTITLGATDMQSGVDKTYYSIDDGVTYNLYTDPFTLTDVKNYSIKFYSVDNLSNQEVPQTVVVKIQSAYGGGGSSILRPLGQILGTSTTATTIKTKELTQQEKMRQLKKKLNSLRIRIYNLKHPQTVMPTITTKEIDNATTDSGVTNSIPTTTATTTTPKKPFWKFW